MLIKNKNRRFSAKLLSLLLCFALLLSLIPSSVLFSAFAAEKDELLVANIADIHYYAKEDLGSKSEALDSLLNSTNHQILQIEGLLDSALYAIGEHAKTKGLKYLFLTGDLALNGEKKAHEELAAKLEAFEESSGVKVYLINGNHDVNDIGASSYKNDVREQGSELMTTPEEFAQIYSELVYGQENIDRYDPPTGRKAGSLSYAVSLEGNYRLIAIDGGKYSFDNTDARMDQAETGGKITSDLMKWIKKQAADAKDRGETIIGLTHWNAVEMNYFQRNILQSFVYDDMENVAEQLASCGINFLFTGHNHMNDISSYINDEGETIYNVQTASLTEFPNTFRESRFTKGPNGEVSVDFELYDVDCETPVVVDGHAYAQPYRETASFDITYENADINDFLMKFMRVILDNVFDSIEEKGGLLAYLEDTLDFNLQYSLSNVPLMDFPIPGTSINLLDSANLLNFVADLEKQIQDRYLNDREYTYSFLQEGIEELTAMPVSEFSSNKFLDQYGFGSDEDPGTIGDLIFSVICYTYQGNEDNSNDKFMLDAISKSYSGELVSEIFDFLVDFLVKDFLQEELLPNVNLNIYLLLSSYHEGVAMIGELALRALLKNDLSYLNVINTLLSKDVLPQYGRSIDSIVENLIDKYITPSQLEGIGYQLGMILEGCTFDESLDYNTNYTYKGKVDVPATSENYRLPSMASLVFGPELRTSYNITWYTKLAVTGSDIELIQSDSGLPLFTGVPTTGANIQAYTDVSVKSFPGVDFGTFGFLDEELVLSKHTIHLTEIDPNKDYYFRVGDASRNWWSEVGMLKSSVEDDSFRFMFATDSQSQTPIQYKETWGRVMQYGLSAFDDTAFVIHGGDFVDNPDNINQWKWCLDAAQEKMLSYPLMPVSGNHEESRKAAVLDHFALENYPKQDTSTGVYYSFEYENAYFAVLNTNNLSNKNTLSDDQLKWLRESVGESEAEWKIVALHKSPYTTGSHANDDDVLALHKQLSTLMTELSIDLILSGHDHIYLRTDVLKNNERTFYNKNIIEIDGVPFESKFGADGSIFVIGGTAGAKHYKATGNSPNFPEPKKEIVDSGRPMFSSIKIDGESLVFEAYSVDMDGIYKEDVFALERGYFEHLTGDLNFDNKVSATDARLALRISAQLEKLTETDLIVGDTNGDGKITATDARKILRVSAKLDSFENKFVQLKGRAPL